MQPHGLLGASNSPSTSLSGSGGSLLDVHVRGLCGCGHRGIYGLSVTLGISKDMISFFLFILNDFDIQFFSVSEDLILEIRLCTEMHVMTT